MRGAGGSKGGSGTDIGFYLARRGAIGRRRVRDAFWPATVYALAIRQLMGRKWVRDSRRGELASDAQVVDMFARLATLTDPHGSDTGRGAVQSTRTTTPNGVSGGSVAYDIGVQNGDDSAYYLTQFDRVVGVEASPAACEKLRKR